MSLRILRRIMCLVLDGLAPTVHNSESVFDVDVFLECVGEQADIFREVQANTNSGKVAHTAITRYVLVPIVEACEVFIP